MNKPQKFQDYLFLRSRILQWKKSMRISPDRFEYRFSQNSGSSTFTRCFALFILDLFKETDSLCDEEEDGLFYPDKEAAVFLASCF